LERLEEAFKECLAQLPNTKHHAVTMTGELVDLFPSRKDGVTAIAHSCRIHLGNSVQFWATDGFVGLDQVEAKWRKIASANWLATASLCALQVPKALMMDMGSTTTDLVAIDGSRVRAQAMDDGDRLISGELVYGGVTRTPLMALGPTIVFQGKTHGVAAEHFATTADVYRLVGKPIHDQYPTADNQGTDDEACARRLARMIGRDLDDAPLESWRELAVAFHRRQMDVIEQAAKLVLNAVPIGNKAPVIGAGQGAFNAEALAKRLNRPYLPIGYFLKFRPEAEAMAETVVTAIAVATLV
jgi:probable H4MPT-linked C1 transfer pathway protein